MEKKISLEDFTTLRFIGKGNYAKVVLVRKKVTNRVYALKILKKKKMEERRSQKEHAFLEREILVRP